MGHSHRTASETDTEVTTADSEFLRVMMAELTRARAERQEITTRANLLDTRITHLQGLLNEGDHSGMSQPRSLAATSKGDFRSKRRRPTRKRQGPSGEPFADADAVVKLLAEEGTPMHYVDIHNALVSRGYHIGGTKGDANTLLSRFFNEDRLERVKAGTYVIKERSSQA